MGKTRYFASRPTVNITTTTLIDWVQLHARIMDKSLLNQSFRCLGWTKYVSRFSNPPCLSSNSRRHGIRNFRIRVLLYGISVPIGYESSAKHFQNFFFGAQWVLCSSMHYTLRRFDNLVIKREIHGAPRRSFWILLFCLFFFGQWSFLTNYYYASFHKEAVGNFQWNSAGQLIDTLWWLS